MKDAKISRRGYYYDLSISPHQCSSPGGEIFKFPSHKKLTMYTRDVKIEIGKARKALARWGLEPNPEAIEAIYKAVYSKFEG